MFKKILIIGLVLFYGMSFSQAKKNIKVSFVSDDTIYSGEFDEEGFLKGYFSALFTDPWSRHSQDFKFKTDFVDVSNGLESNFSERVSRLSRKLVSSDIVFFIVSGLDNVEEDRARKIFKYMKSSADNVMSTDKVIVFLRYKTLDSQSIQAKRKWNNNDSPKKISKKYIQLYDKVFDKICKKYEKQSNVYCVNDFYSEMDEEHFESDHVNLNVKGHEKLSAYLFNFLNENELIER